VALIVLNFSVAVQAQTPKNLALVKKIALQLGRERGGWSKAKDWVVKDTVYGRTVYLELSVKYDKGIISVIEGIRGVGGTEVAYDEKAGVAACINYDILGNTENATKWSKWDANDFAGMVVEHLQYYGLIQ